MRLSRASHSSFLLFIALLTGLVGLVPRAHAQTTTVHAPAPRSAGAEKKWADLTPAQKTALRPLQSHWPSMGDERQRKWLEISKNFSSMSPAQQEALQARMTEWAKMSPDKRAQARLNFVEAQEASKALTPDEKRARWEAYQALSPEEKRKLASTQPAAKSAAPAITPVPAQRLTSLPARATSTAAPPVRTPKIAASPSQVHSNTLLPQSGESPAPKQ